MAFNMKNIKDDSTNFKQFYKHRGAERQHEKTGCSGLTYIFPNAVFYPGPNFFATVSSST